MFGHSFHWLKRLIMVAALVTAVLMALVIIVLRYWILPDIGLYREQISASLASAIGNPVVIGKVEGDWKGLRPRLDFTDVRILDTQQQPALVLPRLIGSVSWMSLLSLELRLASLEINRPELLIRRNAQGAFFIGGVALTGQSDDNNLSDWLLHQRRMVVRDARLTWLDEKRGAPPLVLEQVNLRIESLFKFHQFALRAFPPGDLSTPLDLRGDLRGRSFNDLSDWRGQIFTQIDHTDVVAWRPWLDMPEAFSRGSGALRGWLNVEGGEVVGITADMALHDVATKLGEELPEMEVRNLHGRVVWENLPGGIEVHSKQLTLLLQNGVELKPTDFSYRAKKAAAKQPASSEISANQLQLENIVSLASYVPMDAELRSRLDEFSPRGKLSNIDLKWQGTFEQPDSFNFKGNFEDISVNQVGNIPGVSGLTGAVDGNQESGKITIDSRRMTVNAAGAMREPLSFASVTGQAGWKRNNGELFLQVDNMAVTNDDLDGNLSGSYQVQAGTRGVLDLTGKLTRGDIRRAARYTPLIALHKEGNDWLNDALLAGQTDDFYIRIKGNLSDFPLDGTKDVVFKIGGHARGGVLMFDSKWPRIENINGEFSIDGNVLKVVSPTATMAGASLQNVTVTLPDMMSDELSLDIKGTAIAPSSVFLQFIQNSPVRGYIDGFTDEFHASGNARLELTLHVPLEQESAITQNDGVLPANTQSGHNQVKVAGTVSVQDNDIDLGSGVPLLRKTSGVLSFTETGMRASGVKSEILGGPASIEVQTDKGGAVHASARGRSNLDVLRSRESHPWLNYLSGGATWDADIKVVKKSAQVTIKSNLQGIASSLPQPFAKAADVNMPLHIEKRSVAAGQDVVNIQLGKLLAMRLARHEEKGEMVIKRGMVNFGDGGKWPDREGIWLGGNLTSLSLQGWGGLRNSAGKAGTALPFAGANLHIEKLTGYGQTITGLSVNVLKRGEGYFAQLNSSALSGDVTWQPHGFEKGAKLSLNLSVLKWVGKEASDSFAVVNSSGVPYADSALASSAGDTLQPGDVPALEIAIEDFQYKEKQVGHFSLVGHPDGKDWRLRRLNITNPDGKLVGDGVWLAGTGKPQSQLDLQLDISDAGKMLERSNYPNTVKDGSGKLVANLSWAGGPDKFNYATLNGTLKLDANKGRFLKMEPGIGKLLSVLSLQALPKRITLDFNDVFSDGFQFDNINGNATIKSGVIETHDFQIDGSSAKVTMKGAVDLKTETQNLQVRVLPTVGDSVSLIGAFAAGPAVGMGAFILNKVLGNPLDKLVSFEYNVSGTWVDPKVIKAGRAPAAAENSK